MTSVPERVTARALGEQPKLRVIDGGARDVKAPERVRKLVHWLIFWRPRPALNTAC
jgi:hypothetical protein